VTRSDLRTRVLILAALLAAAFGGLTGRLAWLQVVKRAELAQLAERQYSRTVALYAQRGPILDRQGMPLATSTPTESLFVQPRSVGDPVRVTARLAPIVGLPPAEVHAALTSSRSFVWLRRKLPPAIAAAVRALREPGLGFLPEPLRLYPNRELAAHVVGFEGVQGGLEGIERVFDAELAGTPGKAIVGRDALGREVAAPHVLEPPQPGHGVMLTIDRTIQYIAEREIDAAYRRTGARSAMAVVLDPRTGEVLALVIRPTFNPNTFLDVPSKDHWRNRAVTDPFEPGSTFKVILAAAALEEGVVRPDDRIYGENGSFTIAKTTIHDWKKYGWLTFSEVLQHSSNVGSIKVGLALGRDRFYRYMSAFGFGAATGVGLPGESRGLLRAPGRWSLLSLPTMSIGQEISVTALQMVAAFGAVANGGTLVQPRIVGATFDAEGQEIRRFEPTPVRQVISPETARLLTRILVRAVESGTGHNAAIAGYEVAGKTGTAQKLDPATRRYSRAPGVLSFVGWAPADEPRFVVREVGRVGHTEHGLTILEITLGGFYLDALAAHRIGLLLHLGELRARMGSVGHERLEDSFVSNRGGFAVETPALLVHQRGESSGALAQRLGPAQRVGDVAVANGRQRGLGVQHREVEIAQAPLYRLLPTIELGGTVA